MQFVTRIFDESAVIRRAVLRHLIKLCKRSRYLVPLWLELPGTYGEPSIPTENQIKTYKHNMTTLSIIVSVGIGWVNKTRLGVLRVSRKLCP